MRYFTALFGLTVFLLVLGCHSPQADENKDNKTPNRAFLIATAAVEAVARDTDRYSPRPTITSRYLALTFTAVFDAWSRYDASAVPVYLTEADRRPEQDRTQTNKEIAISHAGFGAMRHYSKADELIFRKTMTDLGLNPDNQSLDPKTPEGIGNLAARAVIAARQSDGSNETGELTKNDPVPYSDYTGYKPLNDADNNVSIDHWQPKYFIKPTGEKFAPGCLTSHWKLVKPLMLDSASMHRPGPPPAIDSEQLAREVKEVVDLQGNLTDEQMAMVEFMRDGPSSVQQAGHWLIFAQHISKRDNQSLDDDVKMFFLVTAAAMDAFIACWDTKMHYDFARPYALVHHFYSGKTIKAWTGKGKNFTEMDGSQWRPYSPDAFLCPAFPAYVSGHSTVSGACAEVLQLYKGNDRFEHTVVMRAGALTHPDDLGAEVTLYFPTISSAAERAGFSRVLGGYHIQSDNIEGLNLGKNVGRTVFEKYLTFIQGSEH